MASHQKKDISDWDFEDKSFPVFEDNLLLLYGCEVKQVLQLYPAQLLNQKAIIKIAILKKQSGHLQSNTLNHFPGLFIKLSYRFWLNTILSGQRIEVRLFPGIDVRNQLT